MITVLYDAKRFGIIVTIISSNSNVPKYIGRNKCIFVPINTYIFSNIEDLNLYKIVGRYKETDYRKFEIK